MKAKELFKKLETYNELAEIMHTQKAAICFGEAYYSERFNNYKEFSKYVKKTYIDEVAAKILNADNFEFDSETVIEYGSGIFAGSAKYFIDIVSNY